MALVIYGSAKSRTMRVLWVAAELGLAYDHIPLAFDDPALKQADFLRLNPAGTVPTLVDGDFALSESLAITLYLAKKHGSGGPEALYPAAPESEATVWRWSLWAQGHLEPWVQMDAFMEDVRRALGDQAWRIPQAALTSLNKALSEGPWLLGEHFTVGDLNVAAVLSPSRAAHLDLSAHDHVRDWLARCYTRPAAVATRQRFQD